MDLLAGVGLLASTLAVGISMAFGALRAAVALLTPRATPPARPSSPAVATRANRLAIAGPLPTEVGLAVARPQPYPSRDTLRA